ncbi:MAG: signal peptidase I [Clostridia bacterium]|nr:signal peptidase I [Clostridia bacterium]MBQ3639850.1 signal peptidase I [Clostridia bacterium]
METKEQGGAGKTAPVWRRIVNIAAYALVGVLVVLVAFLFVSRASGKPTFVGKYTVMWVLTDSMQNEGDPKNGIDPKTYILVEKVDPKTIEVGDVITFRSSDPSILGELNTHRVVEVIGDHKEFRTKGDHNSITDRVTAKAEDVVSRYVRKLPVLTAFGRFFLTGAGLATAFLFIVGITAAMFIPDFVKSSRRKKAKKQEEIDRRVREEVEKMKGQDRNGTPPTE